MFSSFGLLKTQKPLVAAPDRFDIMIDAFVKITEIMRYTTVETFTEEIGGIYAAVTGNTFVLSKLSTQQTSIVTELRQEIDAFLNNRIWFLIASVNQHIKTKYGIGDNDSSGDLEINGFRYDSFKGMNRHMLQMLEFDILRIVERDSDYKRYENESQSMSTYESYDMQSILRMLIHQFDLVSTNVMAPKGTARNIKILQRSDDDYGSTRGMVMLGHMIAKVAQSIMIVKCETDDCLAGIKKARHAMINDEYSKYCNIGSMQNSGILSCFKNIQLLPLAVINRENHIGSGEKTMLRNVLVLSKLV